MKFPFLDFWSRLILKFGDDTSQYGQPHSGIEDYELKGKDLVKVFPSERQNDHRTKVLIYGTPVKIFL